MVFLLGSHVLFISCNGKKEKPVYSNKDLKEIIFRGTYYPENPGELEEIEKDYRERGLLKKGETLKEKYPDLFNKRGKELFKHSSSREYCYNKTKIVDRKPVFKDNLKARLYDKEGNLLSEDFLRLWNPENYDEEGRYSEDYLRRQYYAPPGALETPEHLRMTPEEGILSLRTVISYLPYDERGYKIRIVRLEGRKEVIIDDSGLIFHQSELREKSYVDNIPPSDYRRRYNKWLFDEKRECHTYSFSDVQ